MVLCTLGMVATSYIKAFIFLSMLYILFSPAVMFIYLGACTCEGIIAGAKKYRQMRKG